MPAGLMVPARNMASSAAILRSGAAGSSSGFGSSSALPIFGQMDDDGMGGIGGVGVGGGGVGGQQHHHQLQYLHLDMMTHHATPESNDFGGGGGGGEFDISGGTKSGGSDNGGGSGDDQEQLQQPPNKKKRYHRHTQHQIQEMEAFFKECPHPDDKQRKELSRELGLEPLQVKFWFQNKRTQMKTQHERLENNQLRSENDKLRADNMRYREALTNTSCPNCGGPTTVGEMSFDEHHLRLENARLREEIDRISAIAAKYVGKPVVNFPLLSSPMAPRPLELGVGNFGGDHQPPTGVDMYGGGAGDLLRSISGPVEADKPIIIELAVAAMEELVRMAQMGEPLWMMNGMDGSDPVLNEDEYLRSFSRGIGPKPNGFKSEASRETAVVIMNHVNLVEYLMDVNQWAGLFSGIVSRAMTLEVLSTGVAGNYNGALQVMTAELQLPTPLVPTRESYFARYCKQHADGTWAVVDVSLDDLRPSPVARCRKRPSGCLIQEMPNGYSKVTWIEHVEVDDRGVHNLYKQIVGSGHGFGAKRWVATLDRQCERLASAMATNIPTNDVGGRKSMMKLAERMVVSFCAGVSASTAHTWTTLSGTGADDVRVMTRKSIDDPGRPPGIVLSAATSFWIPVTPKRVFDFLRDENSRSEWDILSNGGVVQEMAHIANGRDTGNCVSLLRVNSANSSQGNMLILQESCTDQTASFVIYAPVDIVAMNVVLNGGDPDYVALLPSGFAILPDGTVNGGGGGESGDGGDGGGGGSLLTVAFQILVDSVPTAKLSLGSVATVNNLIACTVERIKAALSCENAPSAANL
ncbi:Homeobox-leucine zipper protein HDG2 [Linum perenne]